MDGLEKVISLLSSLRNSTMKKILIFIVFIVSAVCAYSQTASIADNLTDAQMSIGNKSRQQHPSLLTTEDYKNTPEWGKYKSLCAVGWTTFGVGIAATTTGVLLLFTSNSDLGSDAMSTASKVTMISGAAITVASVPILCVAYHNRNKAKKIGMSMGVTQLPTPTSEYNLSYTPAMNFTITF